MSVQPLWLGLSSGEGYSFALTLSILPSDEWEGALKILMGSIKSGTGGQEE